MEKLKKMIEMSANEIIENIDNSIDIFVKGGVENCDWDKQTINIYKALVKCEIYQILKTRMDKDVAKLRKEYEEMKLEKQNNKVGK